MYQRKNNNCDPASTSQGVHVTNVGETIPKACGFEDATRFSPILIGWQPHPDCRYRDGDGSFRRILTEKTCRDGH